MVLHKMVEHESVIAKHAPDKLNPKSKTTITERGSCTVCNSTHELRTELQNGLAHEGYIT